MRAAAVHVELRIPDAQSLKGKRAVLRPHLEQLRRLASLSVAEVGHHDAWQRAAIGVAIVAPDSGSLERLIEKVARFWDDRIDVEVVEMRVGHMEEPE